MNEKPHLSLVAPVYNEEGNVLPFVDEIEHSLQGLGCAYELILVDDGSVDNSLQEIKEAAEKHPFIRYISFAKNCGQSAAFQAGFQAAIGDVVVTLDSDLQNDPADIPAMLELYEQGYDMVCGWRAKRKDTLAKKVGSKVGNACRNAVTGKTVRDTGCSLKVMNADMVRRLPMFTGMHRFLPTLMKMQGARIAEMKVNHRPRAHGVSKYTNLQRAVAGSYDLVAVRWMRKRHFQYNIKEKG